MDKITLSVEERKIFGRKVKTLRKEGIVPANVFGKGVKSEAIQIDKALFSKVFKKAGETGVVYLVEDTKKSSKAKERPVLISNIQIDPVSDDVVHVDFRQIDLKQKVTAAVPVVLEGESPAEKSALGTVVQHISSIETEALPADLPEKFTLDISILDEVDKAILVKDLKIDSGKVEIKMDKDAIIVKVEPPQKEEEVAAPAPVVEEGTEAQIQTEAPAEEGETKTNEKKEKEEEKDKPQ